MFVYLSGFLIHMGQRTARLLRAPKIPARLAKTRNTYRLRLVVANVILVILMIIVLVITNAAIRRMLVKRIYMAR